MQIKGKTHYGKENEMKKLNFKLGTELLFNTLSYQLIPFHLMENHDQLLVVSCDKMD